MNETGQVNVKDCGFFQEIEFSHPKGNCLPRQLLHELAKAITEAAQKQETKAILLKSSGISSFCAGASFRELAKFKNIEDGIKFFTGFAEVLLAIKNCSVLVVGRAQGKAVGGGVGILAACDYVFAMQGADLRLSELAIGLGPYVIGPAVERKIGKAHFSAMAIDSEWRSAAWALQYGLYQSVAETVTELDSNIEKQLSAWQNISREAITSLKLALWEDCPDWERLLTKRAGTSARLTLTKTVQERLQQILQKA